MWEGDFVRDANYRTDHAFLRGAIALFEESIMESVL